MAGVLHQQAANRRRNEVSRNGGTCPGTCDRFKELRPYFHSHTIRVLTNYSLRQVLQKLDASSRLLKWAIELSQFEIEFQPQLAIKGQAVADFIVELSRTPDEQPEEAPGGLSSKVPQ